MGKTAIREEASIKSGTELALMRQAGRIVAQVLALTSEAAQPGVTTAHLDSMAEAHIRAAGAVPSFKGYHGYPATLCTSVNEEIVHGIPSDECVLKAGDLLKIDCGALIQGFHGDAAVTVIVGSGKRLSEHLVASTREALQRGIGAMVAGGHVSDVGHAIEQYARSQGYQVVREYCGHGIGRHLHESPPVPNYGPPGQGTRLVPGMVLAIEPMLNAGTWRTIPQADGWTVRTADGKLSAHFEHSVAITEHGPEILTLP